MLKDRKALLEHEIRKTHEQAANMYLSIVVGNGNTSDKTYQTLKEHITDMQFELGMVNSLLHKGHE